MKKLTGISYFIILVLSGGANAFSSVIGNSESLPAYVLVELEKIADASGETNIQISSKKRSVKKQVSVMLDYYIECTKASEKSKQTSSDSPWILTTSN